MSLGGSTITSAANSLKNLFPQDELWPLIAPELPTLALMPKAGGAEGSTLDITVRYGNPQGVSSDFASSQSGVSTPNYARFKVTHGNTYGNGEISGPVLARAKTDKGAVVNELESGQQGLMDSMQRGLAFFAFNNGGGACGIIGSISTNTITLTRPADAIWFDVDQLIELSATDGTSGALLAGTPLQISAIDPRNASGQCVITCTTNITANYAAAAAGNFIFQKGNHNTQYGGQNPVGMLGWLTTPGGGDSFFGFNRSVHKLRLAGALAQGMTGTYKDQIMDALADFATLGVTPDTLVMNPLDANQIVANLGNQIRYDVRSTDIATVNFKSIKFAGPKGDVDIIQDPACPRSTVLALKMKTWKLHWVGDGFPFYDETGGLLNKHPTKDAYQWRCKAYWAPVCYAPGKNGRILLTP